MSELEVSPSFWIRVHDPVFVIVQESAYILVVTSTKAYKGMQPGIFSLQTAWLKMCQNSIVGLGVLWGFFCITQWLTISSHFFSLRSWHCVLHSTWQLRGSFAPIRNFRNIIWLNEGKKQLFLFSVPRIVTESKTNWELEMWEKGPKHREISAIDMLQWVWLGNTQIFSFVFLQPAQAIIDYNSTSH